jgi:hypothetical protein
MTIAISLKVNDGVVLAADSAATIFAQQADGKTIGVINVYDNADKVFNLCKGYPIGVITWGSGSIGAASISTLIKDFRTRITDEIKKDQEYTIEKISNSLSKFIFDEHYQPAFKSWAHKPDIGFMVSGYSSNSDFADEWKFDIHNGELIGPVRMRGQDQVGITWNGEPEAITRLYFGYGSALPRVLEESGISPEKINEIMVNIQQKMVIPLVIPALPIKDAIDLAEFLVDTTIKFSKFSPGAPTVGGPIDIAAITKHEHFKWVKRKYYFDTKFNPDQ